MHHVRQELDDGASVGRGGGPDRLELGVVRRQPSPAPLDERLGRLVPGDGARERVVDHDRAGPRGLERLRVAVLQRGAVTGSERPAAAVWRRASATALTKSGT
jgi:hypothetical protein